MANFQKVHKEKFDFHEFLKCKNFVYVDGKPGKKFVCLLGSRISNVSIDVQKDVFYVNLIKVLDQHNRKVPFERLVFFLILTSVYLKLPAVPFPTY